MHYHGGEPCSKELGRQHAATLALQQKGARQAAKAIPTTPRASTKSRFSGYNSGNLATTADAPAPAPHSAAVTASIPDSIHTEGAKPLPAVSPAPAEDLEDINVTAAAVYKDEVSIPIPGVDGQGRVTVTDRDENMAQGNETSTITHADETKTHDNLTDAHLPCNEKDKESESHVKAAPKTDSTKVVETQINNFEKDEHECKCKTPTMPTCDHDPETAGQQSETEAPMDALQTAAASNANTESGMGADEDPLTAASELRMDRLMAELQAIRADKDALIAVLQTANHDKDELIAALQMANRDKEAQIAALQTANHDKDVLNGQKTAQIATLQAALAALGDEWHDLIRQNVQLHVNFEAFKEAMRGLADEMVAVREAEEKPQQSWTATWTSWRSGV